MALAGALQFDRLGSLSRGRPFCSPSPRKPPFADKLRLSQLFVACGVGVWLTKEQPAGENVRRGPRNAVTGHVES